MTLSHRAQSDRALRKAAREVAQWRTLDGGEHDDVIVANIEEHIVWDFDERERAIALGAFHAERAKGAA